MILSQVDGKDVYSPLVAWLHKNEQENANFMEVITDTGIFYASDFHNIGLFNGSFSFTKDLKE